jgi:hypothetical protein
LTGVIAIPQGRDFSVGFFADRSTRQAINKLANSHAVTIFAGAGVAADQGYPSWSTLVSRMLAQALEKHLPRVSDEELNKVAATVTSQYYQIPTATIVDQVHRDTAGTHARRRRDHAMRSILYHGRRDMIPARPALVDEILYLAYTLKAAGVAVAIVTTNYDDLFETTAKTSDFLSEFADWGLSVRSYSEAPPTPDDDLETVVPIVHVHGYLDRESTGEGVNVVFSEVDYIDWDDHSPFRNYLSSVFTQGTTLMVGTSLRDTNIAAKLKLSQSHDCVRYALLPAQQEIKEVAAYGRQFGENVASFASLRGEQLGVVVLRPDFYGQVAQFLREVALETSKGHSGEATDYSSRLQAWADNWNREHYASRTSIERATDQLVHLSGTVRKKFRANASSVKSELWVRSRPRERRLELWCDSRAVRLLAEPSYRRHDVEINPLADHAAVRCFAARSAIHGRLPTGPLNRWTHFVAVPVTNSTDVPVAVVVTLFDAPKHVDDEYLAPVRERWEWLTHEMLNVATPLVAEAS